MSGTASLSVFLKTHDEVPFLLQWTWCTWGQSIHSSLLPCPLAIPIGEAEQFWALHKLLIHPPGSVVQMGVVGWLPLHCPSGILIPRLLMIPFPNNWNELSSRLPCNQRLFIVSPEFFFKFSYILNKFPIIEANRCSLASLTWLSLATKPFCRHTHSVWLCCLPREKLFYSLIFKQYRVKSKACLNWEKKKKI